MTLSDAAAARFKTAYPFQELVGFRKTEFGDGFSRFELQLAPEHMNRAGIPHGGVYASMLDSALGSAGCYIGEDNDFRAAVTLNLNISFIAAPKGKTLFAQARTVGGGRSVYFAEGEITDEKNTLIARASGTFKYLSPRQG